MSDNYSVHQDPKLVKDYAYFEALRRPLLSRSTWPRLNSTIANRFLTEVRNGKADPHAIVWGVVRQTERQMRGHDRQPEFNFWLLEMCSGKDDYAPGDGETHYAEALLMAQWAVEWNALSTRDRDRIKLEQSRPYVEAWNTSLYSWTTLLNEKSSGGAES